MKTLVAIAFALLFSSSVALSQNKVTLPDFLNEAKAVGVIVCDNKTAIYTVYFHENYSLITISVASGTTIYLHLEDAVISVYLKDSLNSDIHVMTDEAFYRILTTEAPNLHNMINKIGPSDCVVSRSQ